MPLPKATPRRYFRLVVGKVSHWYSRHSTANPLVKPDAKVLDEDKFVLPKQPPQKKAKC